MMFIEIMKTTSDFIWMYPLAILLIATGIYLTIKFKGLQFREFFHSFKLIFFKHEKKDKKHHGDISHFQALMTALAATVGTGNIVGVATAIAIGGPGALFWMWITGLLGMITKFAESMLGVMYRTKNKNGHISGGPMYYISQGLGWKKLAGAFSIFGVIAAIAIGNMIQSNSIADVMQSNAGIPVVWTGFVLMIGTAIIIYKGIHSIGKFTGIVVPIMIGLYLISGLYIIFSNITMLPKIFEMIFRYAFTPIAGVGGFAGAAVMITIRMGIARGLFSNESGIGSAPVVAAAARTKQPMTQALISMTQTFIDTLMVCTITGLVILLTGAWEMGLNGATLTSEAFKLGVGGLGSYIITISLVLFAFSTIVGWSYYGEKFLEYLFGEKVIKGYRVVYVLFVLLGAILSLEIVWAIGDIAIALMAFPNLIAIIALSPKIKKEVEKYIRPEKKKQLSKN